MKPSPFTRHKNELNASMNVVPYIDVTLVLLVIFMVTTPMLTTGVNVDLPNAKTESLGTGVQMPVIVSLKSNGEIFMTYENDIDRPVSQAELIDTLVTLQAQTNGSDIKVMLMADQNNQYGMIMQLMASLQQAGIVKVGLLTGEPLTDNQQQ